MKTRLLAAGVLLWFAIALAYYYAFHRPFTPQFAVYAILAARDVLCTALLFALAGALGTRLLPQAPLPALARLALRAALGLGALSLVYLLAGTLLGTAAWVAWLLALGLLLPLRAALREWASDFGAFGTLWQPSGRLGRGIAILSGVMFVLGLLTALAPPLVFDALVYHLSLPAIYLAQGQVGYVAEITHWGFPQLVHMLVTWAGALGSAHGALVSWGMAALAALGLLGHVAARVSVRAGWVSLAALLSGSSLVNALSSGYVDWPGVLMGWGVLLMLEQWLLTREARWAVWAGVLCGLAFGAKYTSGVLTILGALVFVLSHKRDLRALLRYLAAAFVLALPWLLRNVLYTGNPFYPLLLPGGEMDDFRLAFYQGFSSQASVWDVVFLPFRATWLGIEGGHIGDAAGYETSLGPLLLLFGLLALLPSNAKNSSAALRRVSAIISIGGLVVWLAAGLLSGHLIRSHLYFALFPAFAVLAAFGFAATQPLKIAAVRVGRIAAAVAALALALSMLQSGLTLIQRGVLQLWAGELSAQGYSERNLGLYALVLSELPSDGRTLMLWEARGYACAPQCDPDEVIDRWQHDLARYGSAQAAVASWQAEGYDYVLYNRLAAEFVYADPQHFHAFEISLVEDALSSLPVVQDFNGDYVLYALQP